MDVDYFIKHRKQNILSFKSLKDLKSKRRLRRKTRDNRFSKNKKHLGYIFVLGCDVYDIINYRRYK